MKEAILKKYPELQNLKSKNPYLWINPGLKKVSDVLPELAVTMKDIVDAEKRLEKFAILLEKLFLELKESSGIIESDLIEVNSLKRKMYTGINGKILIKSDHALPVAGSVKARGGIYEVLLFAEKLAMDHGLLSDSENYLKLLDDDVKNLFAKHTISVGSTGNLGLSIGITAAALGFASKVHMSVEAKEWKKGRLRKRGVEVVEHKKDYSFAVAEGRKAADKNPNEYFVDDENSLPLFLGYSVAALRLKDQLESLKIPVDSEHPLFVYLPCGVGGAPCGIAFGLKQVFGDDVHCFLAEPVESPCMMMGLVTDFEKEISVYDIGLNNDTCADGLAVASPSYLAGSLIKNLVSGSFTVNDETLNLDLTRLWDEEGIAIEPSAAAGFRGPLLLKNHNNTMDTLSSNENSCHILWTTGGSFVPKSEFMKFLVSQ